MKIVDHNNLRMMSVVVKINKTRGLLCRNELGKKRAKVQKWEKHVRYFETVECTFAQEVKGSKLPSQS